MNSKEMLSQIVYQMLEDDAFLGTLLQQMDVRCSPPITEDDKRAPGYLSYNTKTQKFQIYLNSEYLEKMTLDQRVGLFQHEVSHFAYGHPFQQIDPNEDMQVKKRRNISQDMQINQYVRAIPTGGVDVKDWKKKDGSPFPLYQSSHDYFTLINQELKEQQAAGGKNKGNVEEMLEGYGNLDHQYTEVKLTEDQMKDMLEEGKKVVKRTLEKTSQSHTTLPQHLQDLLQLIEAKTSGLNYKALLRSAFKRSLSSKDRERTWTRPNKRYGVYSPGSREEKLPKAAFFNDTSGSISIQEQNDYLKIMDEFLKVGSSQCVLAFWHTALYYKKPYRRGKVITKDIIQSGGTDPSCVVKDIKDNKYDLAIILTDGYYDKCDVKVETPVIWIISKGGNKDHPMKHLGITILLEGLQE